MSKRQTFPDRLYVKIEDADDVVWYNALPKKKGHAEIGENVIVGVYELVNRGTIVTAPELLLEDDEAGK